jgi:uncharacterized protein (DUF2249 family)
MTSNLIPEQRPDKNGNIVTRWVRGMFKPKESARTIPKVTIDVSPHSMPRREAKEIFNRLMATMPEGESLELLADCDSSEAGRRLHRRLDDRATLELSFEERQYDLLPLFETFGDTHGYETVRTAAGTLRYGGLELEMTDEALTAYASIRLTIRKAILKGQEEEGTSLPEVFTGTLDLPRHVLSHPEDGPILEQIIHQGVSNKEKILEMLAEIKEGRLAPVISEGFL